MIKEKEIQVSESIGQEGVLIDVDLLLSNDENTLKRMNNYLGQLLQKQKEAGKKFLSDAQIDEICDRAINFECSHSKFIEQIDEELVHKIEDILYCNSREHIINDSDFNSIATKIAKIPPSSINKLYNFGSCK
jgi:hypothetical protein